MTFDLSPVIARLEEFVARELATGTFPGLGLALTDRDGTLHAAGYGLASLETRAPADAHTLFEIGSIGKSFTCFGLMQLADEGKLDPHAPVKDVLPWFEIQSEFAPITLHHLMTHTAAIERGTDGSQDSRWEAYALRETQASLPPGQKFHYSNSGWKTLGLVLERLRGQRYAQIMRERVLAPLGMNETEPVITHAVRPRMATGYVPRFDDRPFNPTCPELVPAIFFETGTADGCIASNAVDMAIYARALLNRGAGLVRPETFEQMTTAYIDRAYGFKYGYGLMLTEQDGHRLVGHGGGMVGYHAFVLADLDSGFAAAAMGNGPAAFMPFARYAIDLLNAAAAGQELPPLPPPAEPFKVAGAADYAGAYRGAAGQFNLRAEGERLLLRAGDQETALLPAGEEHFIVDLPGWERFALRFRRAAAGEDGKAGAVLSAGFGPDAYTRELEGVEPPAPPALPAEWQAFSGFYRSYNPWFPCFTVAARAGQLVLIHGFGVEEDLLPLPDGSFRLSTEGWEPERITFHDVVDGQAIRARMGGCDYTRFGV